MKREMMKLLKQMLRENDAVERNSIKRQILGNFSRLRYAKNDREAEIRSKEEMRSAMTSFCTNANDETRQSLVDNISTFERLFV